jgi:hypothetical protein
MEPRSPVRATLLALVLGCVSASQAQVVHSVLEGMWSDPPANAADFICFAFCTQMGIDYLNALLDDPANDDRPFQELWAETVERQSSEYFQPRLSGPALETFPLDELKSDSGFLRCEPWGLAQQIFAPHQLEIRRFADHVEMRYGEWAAQRTVYLDGRALPANAQPTPLGHSVGHFEGDTLVIESTGIRENHTMWWAKHSDQLRVTERYFRHGDRLLLTATMEDPWGLRQPLELKKVWSWAPDQQIFPYEDCKPAAESEGGN